MDWGNFDSMVRIKGNQHHSNLHHANCQRDWIMESAQLLHNYYKFQMRITKKRLHLNLHELRIKNGHRQSYS